MLLFIAVALTFAALVLAVVDQINHRGTSLTDWACILLAVALLLPGKL